MQNANDNQAGSTTGATGTPDQAAPQNAGPAADLAQKSKEQMQNVAQAAGAQVQNLGQNATAQVQNLGQNAANQVQNLGQAGVNKMSSMLGQITNPSQDLRQPPVKQEEKVYAALSYIPFVAVVSIIIKPDSAFVRLHAKQGILISVLFFFGGILAAIVSLFGVLGQFLAFLIGLIPLGSIIIAVYSMYLSASGFWWKIPVLGAVADLIPVEVMAKVSKENITGQMGAAKNDYDNRQETLQKESVQNQAPVAAQVPGTTAPAATQAPAANPAPADGSANAPQSK